MAKKLDILVSVGTSGLSFKTRKARRYGIPVKDARSCLIHAYKTLDLYTRLPHNRPPEWVGIDLSRFYLGDDACINIGVLDVSNCRQTRCAFLVVKFKIHKKDYFILRHDKDWNDLKLIGGHQEETDNGGFERTARREMSEELGALRGKSGVALKPITTHIHYGPVWSESAKCESRYRLMFYLAELDAEPSVLEKTFGAGSLNYVVDTESIKTAIEQKGVSAFLGVLESEVPGGFEGIPYSLEGDLGEVFGREVPSKELQNIATLPSAAG